VGLFLCKFSLRIGEIEKMYTVPKWITRKLLGSFGNYNIDNDNWYPVWDEKTNDYLAKLLPVSCSWEREVFNIDNSFKVRFCFRIGKFYVSA
jgi:hypothetical protein